MVTTYHGYHGYHGYQYGPENVRTHRLYRIKIRFLVQEHINYTVSSLQLASSPWLQKLLKLLKLRKVHKLLGVTRSVVAMITRSVVAMGT